MIHWLKTPDNPDIAQYIECYWFLEKSVNVDGNDQPKLNPDPSAHLILALPQQSFQYQSNDDISQITGSHWLHPHCKTLQLDHANAFACIGIKFHAGAPYSLPLLSALKSDAPQALIDTITAVDFNKINHGIKDNSNEITLLDMARTAPEKCHELLDKLCRNWLTKTIEDNHSKLTRNTLPFLSKKAANSTINELAAKLFCSQRTLERSFLKVTGLTLKQCQSMNRLEAILEFLYQREQSDIDWLDIAYQFGFSDQPHLIRYLKQKIGVTPQEYASQRGFTIDVYGGVIDT